MADAVWRCFDLFCQLSSGKSLGHHTHLPRTSLHTCRLGDQLSEEQKARVAAEAAAVKSAAAAEAAADALAVKEQQLAEWRQLERASKETATQQLQLSQVTGVASTDTFNTILLHHLPQLEPHHQCSCIRCPVISGAIPQPSTHQYARCAICIQ